MRKSDIRKWVHGILDLLPLLVIPVFMVYSHRHTIDSNSVTIAQNSIVNMKQDVLNGIPLYQNYVLVNWDFIDGYYDENDNYVYMYNDGDIDVYIDVDITLSNNDKYLLKYTSYCDAIYGSFSWYLYDENKANDLALLENINMSDVTWTDYNYIFTYSGSDRNYKYLDFYAEGENGYYLKNLQLFNLTQMYGSGNEPTIEQFNDTWKKSYYSFDSHDKTLVKGISTVTYNDTDIGSQFVYSLYNVTNNYFNFNNVFGFGNLQDWFLLNIFGGNAPLAFYIVWQVVLYEFLMDLIFLIYGLFMWFIDMCEKLMNKPLNAIK